MRSQGITWKLACALIALALTVPMGASTALKAVEVDAPAARVALAGEGKDQYIVGFYKDPFLKEGDTYMGERVIAVDHDLIYIVVETANPELLTLRVRLDENVRYIQLNDPTYGHLDLIPNDTQYNAAGHWGSKKIGAEAAWDITTGSTSIKVAMIDSGIYRTHEDVAGARLLQGWNFIAGNNNPVDESGCSYHGSHTTGTAGATINNGKGIAGISQHTIIPIKGLGYSAPYCTATDTQLANSLKYAGDQGAHISSNSWGGGGVSTTINDAIQYAHDRGVIHIAAAGNSGPCTNCVGQPWKSMGSIATVVASTTESDGQSSFSSEGPEVDVSAPGSNILSLGGGVSSYQTMSGTSMATPHVAGVAALIKALNPTWTFSQVDSQLKNTALDLGPAGWDTDFGYGRIRADLALGGGGSPACSDGIDNDGDGLIDYPADPGCTSAADTDEYNAPTGCTGPANNCFGSPTSIASGGATVSQSTTGATSETGEPAPCGSMGSTVWFTWTAANTGTATIETVGSSYDTVVAAYTGSSLGSLTTVSCNDDIGGGNYQSRITFTATAGTTYRVQAGGYSGATGSLTLKVIAPVPTCPGPSNNCFASPTSVAAGGATVSQSTTGATAETGEPAPCGNMGSTVWFTWTPTTSGTATIETVGSNYDTVVAAYTGSVLTSLTNVACNDDISGSTQSRISFTASAGTTYRIQAGGYSGATGSLTLKVIAPVTCSGPTGNCFSSPTAFTSKPQTLSQTTSGATLETSEPRPCGSIGGTVWFTYTQASTGTVTFATAGSNFDTVVAAYTGSAIGSLTNVACNDDTGGTLQSKITFTATGGVTYRIQAGGYNGATGSSLVLKVS